MLALLLLAITIIFISLKNIKEPYNTNGIVLLGIVSALIGIISTYLGINGALNIAPDLSKVAPHILLNGIKTSLITSIAGAIIMLVSTVLWSNLFIKKHNLS